MSMYNFYDLKDKIKNHFKFSSKEIQYLIISIIFLTVIVAFNDGQKEFVLKNWLFNAFEILLLVILSVMVFVSAQRIMALQTGYKAEYKTAWVPLLIGLAISVITNGHIWYILPVGILWIHTMEIHRVGYFRYGLSLYNYGTAAIMGSIACIGLAFLFKIFLSFSPDNVLILKMIQMNVSIAILNALPIPPLAGSRLFFASRMWYAFAFCGIVGAGILVIFTNIWLSLLGALVLGIAGIVYTFNKFES